MQTKFHIEERSHIYIGRVAENLPGLLPEERVVVITDATVARLYPSLVAPYPTLLVGEGEEAKNLQTVERLYRELLALGADRSWFILGIGGGVVTDIAGFVAATFLRGVRFGFLPTTLLGQVDASIGGKNGVNLDAYKNMVGTFVQPEFVLSDPALLQTLPEREFRAGLAEVVKAAIIADSDLFARLEECDLASLRTDADLLSDAISAAVRVKVDVVQRDEREQGERRKLNLGHTLAHALERCTSQLNHGEAVAVGTALIARVAVRCGTLSEADAERIERLLTRYGCSLTPPVALQRLLEVVDKDKKREGDHLHIVLPAGIGDCRVVPFTMGEFRAFFR